MIFSSLFLYASGFLVARHCATRRLHPLWLASADGPERIDLLTVTEIKEELKALDVAHDDVFEKRELVKRLAEARLRRKPADVSIPQKTQEQSTRESATPTGDVLQTPLFLTSMDQVRMIAAVNMVDGGGISIGPTEQQFATIQIQVFSPTTPFSINLLIDTACSGFVLRPNVVVQYKLPSYSTPVTMSGAGGTVGTTGLTQISSFGLVPMDGNISNSNKFGPIPAAVQEIGALPSKLDGIIGLSFLSQFAAVELDFERGLVQFYKEKGVTKSADAVVAAEDTMRLLPRLGIYVTDVMLGTRGPVTMIVDSGAACTLLNWKGVADLGLAKDSPSLISLPSPMGAMGSDDVAIRLTHRLFVSSILKLGVDSTYPGLSFAAGKRLAIDIGQIPILDTLADQRVGGILGIDALMRCSKVQFHFKGRRPSLKLFR